MANLTITIDEDILKKARIRALQQGTSVNAQIRDFLVRYASADTRRDATVRRVLEIADSTDARRGGRRWTREELHER